MEKAWGLPSFDRRYNGLPINDFNLLETDEGIIGLLGIAHFIDAGLKADEGVALISFAPPEQTLQRLVRIGFDFQEALDNEKLFVYSYQDTFSRTLNISTNYHALFEELNTLAQAPVTRSAFLNADLLFNLQSHHLATISATRLVKATREAGHTVLAHYTYNDTQAHQHMKAVCQSLLSCYITIKRSKNHRFALNVKKDT